MLNQLNFIPIPVDESNLQKLRFVMEFWDGSKPDFSPNQNIALVVKCWYYDPQKGDTHQF